MQPLAHPLRMLLVDDEPLARTRLRTLLGDCPAPQPLVLGEAGDAVAAMAWLSRNLCDVVLLDIHMPGADGMQLSQAIKALPQPPAVVFVTAHAEHAVQAFELDAVDYLTKPVRLERLMMALKKAEQRSAVNQAIEPEKASNFVLIHDRGRTERVPLADIVYLRAELKYVTVRTRDRSLIYDGSLAEFEDRHQRIAVARHAIRALEKHHDVDEGDGWAVRLAGVDEALAVSRRQLAAVREALGKG